MYAIAVIVNFLAGPIIVYLLASTLGAPWWASLILALLLGGLASGLVRLMVLSMNRPQTPDA
jgi:hypothetical protein